MDSGITFEFRATAEGTFIRHFDDAEEGWAWLEGLGDGDIHTEVEAASGWAINEFTAKKVD